MPSLMAARWVGQTSGPVFAVCGPNYTELSLPVRGVRSLQRRFPIDVPEIFAIKSRSCAQNRAESFTLSAAKFRREGATQISDRIS